MRTTLKMSAHAPERVTYGKSMAVLARQADGRWAFVNDADSEAGEKQYADAKPAPGLRFDR